MYDVCVDTGPVIMLQMCIDSFLFSIYYNDGRRLRKELDRIHVLGIVAADQTSFVTV